jgi:hypothetical protein
MLVNLQLLLLDITSSLLTTTLTYTLAPYTGSTATTYTTVGVIGSSTLVKVGMLQLLWQNLRLMRIVGH